MQTYQIFIGIDVSKDHLFKKNKRSKNKVSAIKAQINKIIQRICACVKDKMLYD